MPHKLYLDKMTQSVIESDTVADSTEITENTPEPQSEIEAKRAEIASDVLGVAKKRLIPIALQTLEQNMLNADKAADRNNAANSVLDRFGFASKSGGQASLVAVPVPLEYMKLMMEGLKHFGKDEETIPVASEVKGELTDDRKGPGGD